MESTQRAADKDHHNYSEIKKEMVSEEIKNYLKSVMF